MNNRLELGKNMEAEGAQEIHSKVVRAGRRTYFFDVKATRGDDYFITITESRKMAGKDGSAYYEKHKIHLYKEDFEKYITGLIEAVDYIKTTKPQFFREYGEEPNGNGGIKTAFTLSIEEEFGNI